MFRKSERTHGRAWATFALIMAMLLPALGLGAYAQVAGAAAPPFKGLPNKVPNTVSTTLVISQVYGGGGAGAGGSTYCFDYVELLNVSGAPVSLNGLSFQYGAAANNMSGVFALPNVSVPAGGYYLIQTGSTTTGSCTPLPTPDAITSINMAAASGKAALFNSTTLQVCGATGNRCWPTNPLLIDMVGYGTAADYEGSGPIAGLSVTTAGLRKLNGCQDTDDNPTDFNVTTPAPRNSSSPINLCSVSTSTPTDTPGGATATTTSTSIPPTSTNTPSPRPQPPHQFLGLPQILQSHLLPQIPLRPPPRVQLPQLPHPHYHHHQHPW